MSLLIRRDCIEPSLVTAAGWSLMPSPLRAEDDRDVRDLQLAVFRFDAQRERKELDR